MSVRGVPAQDLPENQDPSVSYTLNEVTGEVVAWDGSEADGDKPKSKRGRPRKTAEPAPVAEAIEPPLAPMTAEETALLAALDIEPTGEESSDESGDADPGEGE